MIEQKLNFIKVSETYLKFNLEYTKSNKDLVKEEILSLISRLGGKFINNKEVFKISIEYDKGSLKTRIVIWGTALCLGITNYGSFRAGVREIINDAKWLSKNVIEQISTRQHIKQNQLIRSEKRTGLVGRIHDIYKRIEKLEKNTNNLSSRELKIELEKIKQEISNITAVLPNENAQEFLSELGQNYNQNLPVPDKSRTLYLTNRYGLKPDEKIEFINE